MMMNSIRFGALVLGIGVMFLSATAQARVVNVSTASQLVSAVLNALPGDEIVIAPGTYTVNVYLSIRASDVTVRGATGNRDDVIVQGLGMNTSSAAAKEGFNLYANDITIQDLTVQEFYYHAIHFQVNIYRPRIRNVVTRNNGGNRLAYDEADGRRHPCGVNASQLIPAGR
jgi:hypothetical protein